MTERPDPVRITDYASPEFTPAVAEIMASVVSMAETLVFEPGALMDLASERTGLDRFGSDRFMEPLGVLCDAFADPATGLSPMGRVSQHTLLTQLLVNRLLVEDELARHPEIHDLELVEPIVIAGLPRTGTTHLHNLMSADPTLRSLPYWEGLEPVLAPAERPAPGAPDPRLERCAVALDFIDQALPLFKRMHEMTLHHAHEEIQLLALDFSTMLFDATFPIPTYRDWYDATDQTESYRYLRTVLKVLLHSRPEAGSRFVLKTPQHLTQFGPLRDAFPDATVVVTHRDPVSVTVSMCTLAAYSARMNLSSPDPVAIGHYWQNRIVDLLAGCVEGRDLLDPDRSIDVGFDEFMADDIAMAERVYDLAGHPFTDDTRSTMAAYMEAHPRGRNGRVVYEPDALGIDPAERRDALAFYSDRFAVTEERW